MVGQVRDRVAVGREDVAVEHVAPHRALVGGQMAQRVEAVDQRVIGVAQIVARLVPPVIDEDVEAIERIRSEEHTSELQSLMRISYAVFCLKKKKQNRNNK